MSSRSFAGPLVLSAPGVNGPAGLVDVDGDGRLDLLALRSIAVNVSTLNLLTVWIRGSGLDYGARREWIARDVPRAFGDIDADGDVDVLGPRTFRNLRFDGPGDGFAVQYGLDAATSGTGGRHPLLGCGGPKRPGQPVELVIGRGRGGASGVLLLGKGRADVLDTGIRRLVDAPYVVRSFVLDGPAGVAGEGASVVSLPVRAALVGRTFTFQAVLLDPGASAGLSATNGLEIRFGGWPVR